MKLAIQTADIEATVTSLKAINEASINDLQSKYITSTGAVVRYEKLSTKGDYAPDDQVNGAGYWVKNKSNPFYLVDNSYDFGANNATDKSQDLILLSIYGRRLCTDYYQFRTLLNEQLDVKTWAGCSDAEKDLIIKTNVKESAISDATDATNKVTYLISSGQAADAESARLFLVDAWAYHHILDVDACGARSVSMKLYEVMGKYLTKTDSTDFFTTVENLYFAFEKQAIKGSLDGSEVAVFDYIESTPGTVYEFTGLESKGYTMQNGDVDMSNFIVNIMDILRKGNY
jgi:hypothetical protein